MIDTSDNQQTTQIAEVQQTVKETSSGFDFTSLVPFLVIIVIFYFLVLRPQENSRKKHDELIKSAKKGDSVIIQGGIHGKVTKSVESESTILVEISNNVEIKVERSSIIDIPSKRQAVSSTNKDTDTAAKRKK